MSGSNYGQPPRTGYVAPPNGPPTGTPSTQSPANPYPSQQEYYRSDQVRTVFIYKCISLYLGEVV